MVSDYRPGIIGFSVMSQQYAWSRALARDIRARFPEVPLCIGGVHPTMVPDEVTASRLFDYVCVGEGEYREEEVLGIEDGVNITVGLPVIRTSVDHGTAFDIAGKGVVSPLSMLEAMRQAVKLASRH